MLGMFIAALNLRIAIIAVSPLLEEIRRDTGMSSPLAGMLTTLPVLCFAISSPLAPRLARRFGLDLVLVVSTSVLALAIVARLLPPMAMLFISTAIIGLAIGIGNVLLPASIKRDFPRQTGLMTGLLTMAISASGAIGAGLTIPLQNATGLAWRGTLALWAIPITIAIIALLPRLRSSQRPARPAIPLPHVDVNLWRDPVAWSVTMIMGLQSFSFYALASWFPTMMADHGMSNERAGFLLSLANFSGFFTSFLVPIFATRQRDQRNYVTATVACWTLSLLGLLFFPVDGTVLWMILWGLAAGSGLGISLSFFSLRSPDIRHAAQLSGMAQTVGYSLAATGPFIIGLLHDLTGGWSVSLLFLIGILGVMLVFGLNAGRDRQVGQATNG
jgi:CP family cyanate transporter-like MFS transporter